MSTGKGKDGKLIDGLNVMRELRIDFLSPVDRPAQEGAKALLLKRVDPKDPNGPKVIVKNDVPGIATSVEAGHAHIIWLHGPVGETTSARLEDEDGMFHDHVYTLRPDGTIEVMQNSGHTHEVDPADIQFALLTLQKSLGDEQFTNQWPDAGQIIKGTEMTDPKKTAKSGEELEATVLDLTERLALNSILAGFSDVEKTHFTGLEEIDKADFVTKSAEDRAEDIADIVKLKEADDPIVYKSADGDVYRKSDDPRMVRSARKADRAEKRAEAAEIASADSGYSKRAESELSHLPGTTAERAALLKAVNSIEDPGDRDAAMEALKASDKALAGAFKTAGTGSGVGDDADSPGAKLDSLVKRYVEKNDGVTEAGAFVKVLETDEGKALYGEMRQQ